MNFVEFDEPSQMQSFFCFMLEVNKMRIILDTNKKTVTVPWNYSDKLAEMNQAIMDATGDVTKRLDFKGYLESCWKYAMDHSDTNLKTAQKPKRPTKED